jgi:hypothetical protein
MYTEPLQGGVWMKGWLMYMQIQMMKNEGFSKRQVADKQGLNFRTVAKYWDMHRKRMIGF